MNYLLSNGIYTTPKTSLNMPFEGYWILLVFNASKKESNHSGAWIFQIAISTDSNNKALYFRRNINYKESGWETWRTISATWTFNEAITDIQLTLENETNRNIKIIAEGHLDLSRKLDDALKVDTEKEMLLIRVNRLENEVRRLKERISEIA